MVKTNLASEFHSHGICAFKNTKVHLIQSRFYLSKQNPNGPTNHIALSCLRAGYRAVIKAEAAKPTNES